MSDSESDESIPQLVPIGDNECDSNGPTALAQVMANILASSKGSEDRKPSILSKTREKSKKKTELEKNMALLKREASRKKVLAKLAWERMAMVKPTIEGKDRERNLAKVATRGVVHLFNAVAEQQDRLRSQLGAEGTTDTKRTKIVKSLSRSSFIDLLKSQSHSGASVKLETPDKTNKFDSKQSKEKKQPKWNALRDDFAMSEYASGIGAVSDDDNVKPEPC